MKVLEDSIQHAQRRESSMLEMSQWVTEVNSVLQARLDADILAGDVPNEFQVCSKHCLLLLYFGHFTKSICFNSSMNVLLRYVLDMKTSLAKYALFHTLL